MIDAALRYRKDPNLKTEWNLVEASGEMPILRSVVYVSDFSDKPTFKYWHLGIIPRRDRGRFFYLPLPRKPRFGHGDSGAPLTCYSFVSPRIGLTWNIFPGRSEVPGRSPAHVLPEGQLEEDMEQSRRTKGNSNNLFQFAVSAIA